MYPPEDHSDQSSEVLLAELIREQVLNRTREEIPHSVEVSVKEIAPREDGLVTVRAEVWAETESQKGILIGKGGRQDRRDRHRRPPLARSRAGRPRSTSTSRSASAAAGAATRTCSTAWASSSAAPRHAPRATCHYDVSMFERFSSTSKAWCRALRRTSPAARC